MHDTTGAIRMTPVHTVTSVINKPALRDVHICSPLNRDNDKLMKPAYSTNKDWIIHHKPMTLASA